MLHTSCYVIFEMYLFQQQILCCNSGINVRICSIDEHANDGDSFFIHLFVIVLFWMNPVKKPNATFNFHFSQSKLEKKQIQFRLISSVI